MARAVLLAQGVYYVLTGLWAVVHLRSFEAITGPKTDKWLVKAVGSLVAVSGAVMVVAGLRRRPPGEVALLAAGEALALASIDVVYASRGRISRLYLLDVLPEVAAAFALVRAWPSSRD